MSVEAIKAPYPYFGGKGRMAGHIWRRFGDTANYVEPFAGSLAVLLSRPHAPRTETVNDIDGLLCNFWRALQHDPEGVAYYASSPVNEIDLHARHLWLLARKADVEAMLADPDAHDAKVAGWWVWGMSLWIGSGWCSGAGPWRIVDGRMTKGGDGEGVERPRPHLSGGQGVARQARRLTGTQGVQRADLAGVARQVPYLRSEGQGINRQLTGDARQLPYLSHGERGVQRKIPYVSHGSRGDASAGLAADGALLDYLCRLAERVRRVRVCCGDWTRVVTPAVTVENGTTAVLLDPPYSGAERKADLYAHDDGDVAAAVRQWALEHGDDPRLRIALCGYDTPSYAMPAGWAALRWKAAGGYGSQGEGRGRANAGRETIWFSRHCLRPGTAQMSLFAGQEAV